MLPWCCTRTVLQHLRKTTMARKILDIGVLAQKVYLDADEEAVRDLALGLLKVVRQRPGGRQRGTSTIPDSDVNELVCLMLDRCRSNGIPLSLLQNC